MEMFEKIRLHENVANRSNGQNKVNMVEIARGRQSRHIARLVTLAECGVIAWAIWLRA